MNASRRLHQLFILSLLLSVALVLGTVSAGEKKTIFYNLTTDEAWAAGMALGQATKALENGYDVAIFLNVRGVFLASKKFTTDGSGASGKSLREMLETARDKGAKVIICPMCMEKAGLTMNDVIEGVVKGGPDVTMKTMTADNTAVISF